MHNDLNYHTNTSIPINHPDQHRQDQTDVTAEQLSHYLSSITMSQSLKQPRLNWLTPVAMDAPISRTDHPIDRLTATLNQRNSETQTAFHNLPDVLLSQIIKFDTEGAPLTDVLTSLGVKLKSSEVVSVATLNTHRDLNIDRLKELTSVFSRLNCEAELASTGSLSTLAHLIQHGDSLGESLKLVSNALKAYLAISLQVTIPEIKKILVAELPRHSSIRALICAALDHQFITHPDQIGPRRPLSHPFRSEAQFVTSNYQYDKLVSQYFKACLNECQALYRAQEFNTLRDTITTIHAGSLSNYIARQLAETMDRGSLSEQPMLSDAFENTEAKHIWHKGLIENPHLVIHSRADAEMLVMHFEKQAAEPFDVSDLNRLANKVIDQLQALTLIETSDLVDRLKPYTISKTEDDESNCYFDLFSDSLGDY